MKCEEFEAFGLDAERDTSLSEAERTAAAEHAGTCSRCAALQDSWQRARVELRAFAADTVAAQTPARAEMRLRQDFRTQHRTLKLRRAAVISAWALATAAVLIGAVNLWNWQRTRREEGSKRETSVPSGPAQNPVSPSENSSAAANETGTPEAPKKRFHNTAPAIVDDEDAGRFTLLPGSLPAETEEAAIVRVRIQRGALGALGLPVNEEGASEWIQVDLLVGNDGLPQAVRLAR
jgi:hypothetical protein